MKKLIISVAVSTVLLSSIPSQANPFDKHAKGLLFAGASAAFLLISKWCYEQGRYHATRIQKYGTDTSKISRSIVTLDYIRDHTAPNNDLTHIQPRTIENLVLMDHQKDSLNLNLTRARSILGGGQERDSLRARIDICLGYLRGARQDAQIK